MNFTQTASYKNLLKHKEFLSDVKIANLFASDENRFSKNCLSVAGILFDFSKNLIDEKGLDFLVKMADQLSLKSQIRDMFDGVKINMTEGRSVLHTALRAKESEEILLDGKNIVPEIAETRRKCYKFAEDVRSGAFKGATGARILDVVNIGIGGSHLGPKMAEKALKAFKIPLIKFHFVSNVDAADLMEVLDKCEPATTLFIISSKTFATDETMTNAQTAKMWLASKLGEKSVERHFCAVSTAPDLTAKFGIAKGLVFPFGDYVGGRYSMWGPIGLSLMMAIGASNFDDFLRGARDIDEHFKTAELRENVPVLMALISIWNNNFLGAASELILPYASSLSDLPSYLQQLVMESNGKSITKEGKPTDYQTSPVLFGEAGTNGQHSFYQLIHQGTRKMLCNFILVAKPPVEEGLHELKLLANGIAQSEALMNGLSAEELKGVPDKLKPFKSFEGNRPSNTFLMDSITPYSIGALVALFEHKTFVEGVLWDINSFDQFGVELGKKLAVKVLADLTGNAKPQHDSSTNSLISMVKELRG